MISSSTAYPCADLKGEVRAFWNEHPCGLQFGGGDCGSRAFFERVERHRYRLEPHIHEAADFPAACGRRVLEIGCGLGTDAVQFLRAGAAYTGIDLTPRAVELTRQRIGLLHLHADIRVGDAEALDFDDDSFDIVYSHGVLHHTPDTAAAIREIRRVLRPGGRSMVMLYNRISINHYIKVRVLRRLRAPLLRSDRGVAAVHRIWPERLEELQTHARLIRANSRSYLRAETFLTRNTDGAACPVSRVYSTSEARALFSEFEEVECRTYSRMPEWWPRAPVWQRLHRALGGRWGWHLWVYARKPLRQPP